MTHRLLEARPEGGTLTLADEHGRPWLRAVGQALLGDGRCVGADDSLDGLSYQIENHPRGCVIRLRFVNRHPEPVFVEQLRPLVADTGYGGLPLEQLRIQRTGWQSWSRSHPPAPFMADRDIIAPPIRGPYLPHRHSDSQVEPWVAILEADAQPSLLLGFLSARTQLGTIEIRPLTDGTHSLQVATELEGREVGPDAEIWSEPLLIATGTTDDLVDLYAREVAERMNARTSEDVLTGWCSWYQLYTDVAESDVLRNVETLTRQRARLPVRLIQLDDGYEHEVGDWLEINQKFPSGLVALVDQIRDRDFVPGVWLAPFLLSARSHTYAAHPDWVVRDDAGQPVNAIDNWGSANYALDTTHPEALAWLQHVVRTVCETWGFAYLKLDFLYAAAMRGRRHDAQATAVEAYRRGLETLRASAGDRFILGCGAPLLPSIGLVDGMRVGSDVGAYWGVEGRADGPSLRNAMRATLARLWTHGRWWMNDPDCVLVRDKDTDLSLAEIQAWASVVALSGGMVFVGDDVSRLDPSRRHILERLLPPSGQPARSGGSLVESMPQRLHLKVERSWATWDIVAIANWSDRAVAAWFDPAAIGLHGTVFHAVDLWSGAHLGRHVGPVALGEIPSHGLRLLAIHPDLGRPQVIGSTGHLLGDALDLEDEMWDAYARTLTVKISRRGPSTRRGDLVVYEPSCDSVRHVPFASAAESPVVVSCA